MLRAGTLLIVGLALGLPALAGQSAAPRSPEEELARWDRMFATEPAHIRWEPTRFLIEVAPTLKPGDAIDVGMGSGRNALYLAQSGWRVTGVDTSAVGVERARGQASLNKLAFAAVQSDMFTFDYGSNRYDLVLFMYMGPVGDLGERFVRALKPGGISSLSTSRVASRPVPCRSGSRASTCFGTAKTMTILTTICETRAAWCGFSHGSQSLHERKDAG